MENMSKSQRRRRAFLPKLRRFVTDFKINIITFIIVVIALFIAVAVIYNALLRFSYVTGSSIAGIYASEYDHEKGTIDYVFGLDRYMEGSSYYLCDKDGELLFYDTDSANDRETIAAYAKELIGLIESGEAGEYDQYIHDMDGKRRGVYYVRAQDGCWSVVTMPYTSIFRNLRLYIYIFSFVALMFLIANIVMILGTLRDRKQNERLISTIRALSNTYYGLYRVNFEDHTYELVRGSEHVRDRMPPKGNYEDFLKTCGEVIEESAFEDFCDSFSIDNIKKLIRSRIRDFGGDFLRNFDGDYRWVNVSLRFDESLDKDEVLLCFREVNEAKKKQLREREVLLDAIEISNQNMEAKQAFFNNMSHDMRTPLNAILGITELAKGRLSDKEKMEDYLSKIEFSGRQLLTLINDILDVSKAEQGRLSLNERAFYMSATVKEALEPFMLQASSQKKSLSSDIASGESPVMGDPDRVIQIVNNLVSNAIKFTREGGLISVSLKFSEAEDTVTYTLKVKDNGIGMTKEFLPHLFEPYYQEKRFTGKSRMGTGLGMSIVGNLVKYMNGDIAVSSEPDLGTEFIVRLTFMKSEEPKEKPSLSDSSSASVAAPDVAPLQGTRLLLAEDNEINMEIALEMLTSLGASVESAWDGKEALDKFKASPEGYYDAVLMDMQMPVMNGIEATSKIRGLRRSDSRKVPIIAVTANAFSEDIAAQQAAGMNDHVLKPIDFKSMVTVLKKYL